jgi:carboxymethylenebutenolidase
METHAEDIRLDDRTVAVVRPIEHGPWPGVLMVHEAFGIDDVLRRHAQRLASAGYVVYAPDLIGEGLWLRCVVTTFRAFRARVGKPFEVIESSRQQLLADPGCTGKVGVIGFCLGGGFALLLSADGYHASAVNYGQIPDDVDDIASRACPIVASYGGRDWLADDVPALKAALDAHSVPHDLKVYPTAGHTFLNDEINGPGWFRPVARRLQRFTHAGPDPIAASDAWRRIEAFFALHLGSATNA